MIFVSKKICSQLTSFPCAFLPDKAIKLQAFEMHQRRTLSRVFGIATTEKIGLMPKSITLGPSVADNASHSTQ
jgi:hypothetical protein